VTDITSFVALLAIRTLVLETELQSPFQTSPQSKSERTKIIIIILLYIIIIILLLLLSLPLHYISSAEGPNESEEGDAIFDSVTELCAQEEIGGGLTLLPIDKVAAEAKEAMTMRDSAHHLSSSSTITMSMRTDNNNIDTPNHGRTSTAEKSDKNNNTRRKDEESLWRNFAARLYEFIVNFVAIFIADVVSHPRLRIILVDVVVSAINAFMTQDDIGTKMDDTARRVLYDTEKARQASKELGREVVPIITGFFGGVASSLKPSAIKRRKAQRKSKHESLRNANMNKIDRNSEPFVSDMTNSQGYRTTGVGEDFEDAKDEYDD
jgi:hypothetical protein